jgi:hypothetical protein
MLNNNISLVIIVYSYNNDFELDMHKNELDIFPAKIVFIEDTMNIYYDFYKYKMAYDYLIDNNIKYNWALVMNDSIILCEPCFWIIDKIVNNTTDDYIGIYELEHNISQYTPKIHYQSWWLNFKPHTYKYLVDNLNFTDKHKDVMNIILDYEVDLGNNMINTFKSSAIYPILDAKFYDKNIFYNHDLYMIYWNTYNFKFMKIKNIIHELLPENLRHIF